MRAKVTGIGPELLALLNRRMELERRESFWATGRRLR